MNLIQSTFEKNNIPPHHNYEKVAYCQDNPEKNRQAKKKRRDWMIEKMDGDLKLIYENASKHGKRIILELLNGNWGRNTNLRGSAPTPGIGMRRKVHKRFNTITTPEQFTSKTCICCHQRTLANPRITRPAKFIGPKSKKSTLKKPRKNKFQNFVSAKHHLLRCTNVSCCRWFHRDDAGSFNILHIGLDAITP
jgi:hypothetical protein